VTGAPPVLTGDYWNNPSTVSAFAALPAPAYLTELLTAPVPDGATALDAGCGTGRNLPSLVAAGYRVLAIDLHPGMLDEARARHAGPDVTFANATITSIPAADRQVALVVCHGVLHNLHDRKQLGATMGGVADVTFGEEARLGDFRVDVALEFVHELSLAGPELFVEFLQRALPPPAVPGEGDVVSALRKAGRLERVGLVDEDDVAAMQDRLLDRHGLTYPGIGDDGYLDATHHQIDVAGHDDVCVSKRTLLPVLAAVTVPRAPVPLRRAGLRIGPLDTDARFVTGLPQIDVLSVGRCRLQGASVSELVEDVDGILRAHGLGMAASALSASSCMLLGEMSGTTMPPYLRMTSSRRSLLVKEVTLSLRGTTMVVTKPRGTPHSARSVARTLLPEPMHALRTRVAPASMVRMPSLSGWPSTRRRS
jgi:SAM-dependent methyltransferase